MFLKKITIRTSLLQNIYFQNGDMNGEIKESWNYMHLKTKPMKKSVSLKRTPITESLINTFYTR